MQKMCSLIPPLMFQFKSMAAFDDQTCRDVFVALLKAFTIHGEHAENISPLIQVSKKYLKILFFIQSQK